MSEITQLLSPFYRLTAQGFWRSSHLPQRRYKYRSVTSLLPYHLHHLYSNIHTNLTTLGSDQCNFKTFIFDQSYSKLQFPKEYFKVPQASETLLKRRASQSRKFVKGCRPLPSLTSHNACYQVRGSENSCNSFFSKY